MSIECDINKEMNHKPTGNKQENITKHVTLLTGEVQGELWVAERGMQCENGFSPIAANEDKLSRPFCRNEHHQISVFF